MQALRIQYNTVNHAIGAVAMPTQIMACGSGGGAQREREYPLWPNSPRGQYDYTATQSQNSVFVYIKNKQILNICLIL